MKRKLYTIRDTVDDSFDATLDWDWGSSTCDLLIDKYFINKRKSAKALDDTFGLGTSLLHLIQSMRNEDSIRLDSKIGVLHE